MDLALSSKLSPQELCRINLCPLFFDALGPFLISLTFLGTIYLLASSMALSSLEVVEKLEAGSVASSNDVIKDGLDVEYWNDNDELVG
jgi:hypothetical protein